MSAKKSVYKPRPVSGFPEWLPQERLVEQTWFDHIRKVFESYGFCSVETPSVEELEVLEAKGEVDKEIYVIERLHKDDDDDSEARLALHFDQTVPLARYVAQHFNELVFPFKRYQIQRVWRGERPQAGRFREFYQCDIDVIHVDNLPLHFDAEMPVIMWDVLSGLPGLNSDEILLQLSNRKILSGVCQHLGIDDIVSVTRIIDKLEKIGEDDVKSLLQENSIKNSDIEDLLLLASIKTTKSAELRERAEQLGIANDIFAEGIEELCFVLDYLSHLPENAYVADLSIVRGLDYYTGTVYETRFRDNPDYGSICSGGRYDDLAGSYINRNLPGVGISLGFSRLFDYLRSQNKLPIGALSPADVLVIIPSTEQQSVAEETARILRARGIKTELYHAPQKLKKQLSYAEKKGIPHVWFPPFGNGAPHEVKNMYKGDQQQADPEKWMPAKEK